MATRKKGSGSFTETIEDQDTNLENQIKEFPSILGTPGIANEVVEENEETLEEGNFYQENTEGLSVSTIGPVGELEGNSNLRQNSPPKEVTETPPRKLPSEVREVSRRSPRRSLKFTPRSN